jgi:hypothetical protein
MDTGGKNGQYALHIGDPWTEGNDSRYGVIKVHRRAELEHVIENLAQMFWMVKGGKLEH